MGTALPGTHLCEAHQGNHSHYAPSNCAICRLRAENEARAEVQHLQARRILALTAENEKLRKDMKRLRVALEEIELHNDQHAETCRAALAAKGDV